VICISPGGAGKSRVLSVTGLPGKSQIFIDRYVVFELRFWLVARVGA
jgi:hypothetical protein